MPVRAGIGGVAAQVDLVASATVDLAAGAVVDVSGFGSVNAANSTTTPLAGGATWTGTWADCSDLASLSVVADADVAATLFVDFSTDGATAIRNVQLSDGLTGAMGIHSLTPIARYYRARVVNGVGAQGSMTVQTLGNEQPRVALPTSRLAQTLGDYSDVLNVRAGLFGRQPGGDYGSVALDEASRLQVTLSSPLTAFGELRVASPRPIAQIDAVYGIPDGAETFIDPSPGTGTATASGGNFVCQTGAGVGGYAVVRTRRGVRYRAGQGCLYRFTALFDTGNAVALSVQGAGAFNASNGFLVGYDAANGFGVMHRTSGAHEVRTLTASVGAGGAETLTLTLNTVAYSIALTSGTTAHNCHEIAVWLTANQTVWDAYQYGATVVLFGRQVGAKAGTYSATSGGGAFAATIAQTGAGAANVETWTYQSAFNIDPLDGAGPSGMTLDPSKGNVYEIVQQHLGYGDVDFRIERPESGRFFTFHRFRFAGARTTPTLQNPTLKVGWFAASLGSTTNITVKGASAYGAVEGDVRPFRRPRAFSSQRAAVGATLTSIFAIRVRSAFGGQVQLSEVLPRLAFISPEGNKACECKILLNPTFAAATNWTYVDSAASTVATDTTGTTFSATGTELASFVVAGLGTGSVNLEDLDLYLSRGDVLCIAARITGGAGSNITASLTWLED